MAKRLLPEAMNFVANAILALLPRRKGFDRSSVYPDLQAPNAQLSLSYSSSLAPQEPVDLPSMLSATGTALDDISNEQTKANLLAGALRLVDNFATLYASSPAFIELITPMQAILEGSRVAKLSQPLGNLHSSAMSTLSRMLKHAHASRRPLSMQAHKPIPIASYAPKFDDDFAPGRHYDPDAERNSTAKVRAGYKKERKGAIRELRKDNRFLAGEKAREQQAKDSAYVSKMRRVEGDINMERAEEKEMQREKAREKRRAGRK